MDSSEDTLSFSSMAQRPHANKLHNSSSRKRAPTDSNFASSHVSPPSSSPADLLFSNGRLVPHFHETIAATDTKRSPPSSSSNSRRSSNISSRSSSASSAHCNTMIHGYGNGSGRSCLIRNGSVKSSAAVPKRVSFQLNEAGRSAGSAGSGRVNGSRQGKSGRARKTTEKQRQAGLCSSLVSACRECHAFEPSKHVKTSNNTSKNVATWSKCV